MYLKTPMSAYKVDINVKNTNVYLSTQLLANSRSCEKQYDTKESISDCYDPIASQA